MAAALVKSTTGTVVLSGSNSYTGGTALNDGMLAVTNAASLGAPGGGLSIGAGTLEVASGFAEARSIALTGPSAAIQVDAGRWYANSGTLSGGGGLAKTGDGLLLLCGGGSMQSQANVNSGTLQIDGTYTLPILNVNNSAQLAGSGSIVLTSDGLYYKSSQASTFAGSLVGGADSGVEVNNPAGGSLTLTGTSSYGGGTTLTAGMLVVSNSAGSATGTAAVTLNGGTLASGGAPSGSGRIGGDVIAGTGGHLIAPGGVGPIGTLNLGGALSLNGKSTLDFDISGTSHDLLSIAGSLNVAGLPAIALNYSGALSGNYVLASYPSSSGMSGTSSFNILTPAPAGYKWDITSTGIDLELLLTHGSCSWTGGGGDHLWSTAANWAGNVQPSASGDVATFDTTASGGTITLDAPQTVGGLTLNNGTASYTLAGTTLTLDNGGAPAAVTVVAGTHSIAAPIILSSSGAFGPQAGTQLTLSGDIGDGGRNLPLSLTDGGTLILSGTNTYGGGTYVDAGTLVVQNSAALLDGSSLVVGAGGVFVFDPSRMAGSREQGAGSEAAAGVAPVPEPGPVALLLAAAGIATVAWRRRKAR